MRISDWSSDVFSSDLIVGAAIGLAGEHGDFRRGGLGIGEQQLGTMLDNAAIFLRGARQEAGYIDESDDRNVVAVAEMHEPCAFAAGIDVETAGQHHRLVGDDTHGLPANTGETGDRKSTRLNSSH